MAHLVVLSIVRNGSVISREGWGLGGCCRKAVMIQLSLLGKVNREQADSKYLLVQVGRCFKQEEKEEKVV